MAARARELPCYRSLLLPLTPAVSVVLVIMSAFSAGLRSCSSSMQGYCLPAFCHEWILLSSKEHDSQVIDSGHVPGS